MGIYEAIEPFIEHQGERRSFWLRKPRAVGERILVARADVALRGPAAGRVVVRLEPGNAFGTGGHGTTEGCLVALERCVRGGESVLDVGTGTGILAIAARKLGAARVVAVDIDPGACRATRKNLALNGIGGEVEVTEGGVETVAGRFGVVAANIRAPILAGLLGPIAARLSPGSLAIFSGILERELPWFQELPEVITLRTLEIKRNNGWMTVVCASGPQRPAPGNPPPE